MNYYNENDPKAAAWLRELIRAGEIPDGFVDERSIAEVESYELTKYSQCHFFAGIGGWPLALRIVGWPETKPVWTGSCPCQPFSIAGRGMGVADERHLWPYFRNHIGKCRPATVFGEQVTGTAGRAWLAGIQTDLEKGGFAFCAGDLCAAGVAAPHKRQRHYWMAHTKRIGWTAGCASLPGCKSGATQPDNRGDFSGMDNTDFGRCWKPENTICTRRDEPFGASESDRMVFPYGSGRNAGKPASERTRHGNSTESASGYGFWNKFDIAWCRNPKKAGEIVPRRIESDTFPMAYGIPNRVGLLRGYGNAIVPELAAAFIKASIIICK